MSDDVKTENELMLEARLAVLKMAKEYGKGIRVHEAYECFVYQYNSGSIEIEPWIRKNVKRISVSTLFRWRSLVKKSYIYALSHKRGGSDNRSHTGILDQLDGGIIDEMKLMMVELMEEKKHLKCIPISNHLRQYFPEAPDVSETSWRRAIRRWKKEIEEDAEKVARKAQDY
jgi:hypothetical protein